MATGGLFHLIADIPYNYNPTVSLIPGFHDTYHKEFYTKEYYENHKREIIKTFLLCWFHHKRTRENLLYKIPKDIIKIIVNFLKLLDYDEYSYKIAPILNRLKTDVLYEKWKIKEKKKLIRSLNKNREPQKSKLRKLNKENKSKVKQLSKHLSKNSCTKHIKTMKGRW